MWVLSKELTTGRSATFSNFSSNPHITVPLSPALAQSQFDPRKNAAMMKHYHNRRYSSMSYSTIMHCFPVLLSLHERTKELYSVQPYTRPLTQVNHRHEIRINQNVNVKSIVYSLFLFLFVRHLLSWWTQVISETRNKVISFSMVGRHTTSSSFSSTTAAHLFHSPPR